MNSEFFTRFFIYPSIIAIWIKFLFHHLMIFYSFPESTDSKNWQKDYWRLVKHQENDKYLSFEEYMSPPTSMIWSSDSFLQEGLEWVENTPNELEAATIEMLERTDDNNSSRPDDDLQQRFKIVAEKCGQKYGGHLVKAFAPISREFLHKHVDLLE